LLKGRGSVADMSQVGQRGAAAPITNRAGLWSNIWPPGVWWSTLIVFCCFWRAVLVSHAAFLRYIFTLPSRIVEGANRTSEAIRRFTVDIGKRLRELRQAKGLSQRDVEDLTGLQGPYVSRVENGHTTPKLPVLEKWARALDIDLHQLFDVGYGQPEAPKPPARVPTGERTLLELFRQIPADDRSLLISLAREMVRRKGIRG